MSDYEELKRAGHTPMKAAQIIWDARRGDTYAVEWIALCKKANTP